MVVSLKEGLDRSACSLRVVRTTRSACGSRPTKGVAEAASTDPEVVEAATPDLEVVEAAKCIWVVGP